MYVCVCVCRLPGPMDLSKLVWSGWLLSKADCLLTGNPVDDAGVVNMYMVIIYTAQNIKRNTAYFAIDYNTNALIV